MDTKRLNPEPQTLSPSGSSGVRRRRRRSSECNSPEFEFWMVRNPSFPQPNILSADELFVDGVLLPLHLLSAYNKRDPPDKTLQPDREIPNSGPPVPEPDPEPGPGPKSSPAMIESAPTVLSASKRWKDIFRKSDKKNAENNNSEENEKDKEKGKKKERKGGSGATSAELNINIWPFSRSRSAGNAGIRPKLFPGAPGSRKVNSAPCSRSNSAGESKSKKWPSSPGRAGVHLGRSSPVWQVRRGGFTSKIPEPQVLDAEKVSKRDTPTNRRSKVASSSSGGGSGIGSAKTRVLNLNVPTCIGHKHHLSCRSYENSTIAVSGATNGGVKIRGNNNGGNGGDGNVGGKLFNLRSLFTKKNVVTSN